MLHQFQLKFYNYRWSAVEWGLIIIFYFLQTFRTDPLQLNAIGQVVENFIRNFAIVFWVSLSSGFPHEFENCFFVLLFLALFVQCRKVLKNWKSQKKLFIKKKILVQQIVPYNKRLMIVRNLKSKGVEITFWKEMVGVWWCTFEILWCT